MARRPAHAWTDVKTDRATTLDADEDEQSRLAASESGLAPMSSGSNEIAIRDVAVSTWPRWCRCRRGSPPRPDPTSGGIDVRSRFRIIVDRRVREGATAKYPASARSDVV